MTSAAKEIREWLEKIPAKYKGDVIINRITVIEYSRASHTSKVIASVALPSDPHRVHIPRDIEFICGYCLAVADMHMSDGHQTKLTFRIRARGEFDGGKIFEHNKNIERTAAQAGIPF